ncbi:hypothetical protein TGME49_241305 [Toxoplasma gondii ME49]|nr:hypothetical protein TGME49_241305 [Toxoplasma gondii ME49]EPT30638.1 hypothetical protein TGME49_241305 [Toxoplasma gondii ME49]|eukprot:XP_018637592.1 hypothetical protein TGME49_241305 [Toxoplasma gondii ME49]
MLKPARDPEGARGVGSSSVSVSQASSVVGTQARWLAEGSPGEEPDPVRELLDLEEELQDLLALRHRERQCFRQCVRQWGSAESFVRHCTRQRSTAATDPETLKQMFEQKREEKEAACNVWAALLDALYEKIEAVNQKRKKTQKQLTQGQLEQYRATKAARDRAEGGRVSSRSSSGEAADPASTSQPPGGAEGTPDDGGSVETLDRELARVRRQLALTVENERSCLKKLRTHLEHSAPLPMKGMPSPERERSSAARRKWMARRLQLEQDAELVHENIVKLRERLGGLKQRKNAFVKVRGFPAGTRGCANAALRFSAYDITVDERAAATPWFQRPNFLSLSHRSSGAPPAPAARPPRGPRHNVFPARSQHVSRASRKPGNKSCHPRAAEGSGEKRAESKASKHEYVRTCRTIRVPK